MFGVLDTLNDAGIDRIYAPENVDMHESLRETLRTIYLGARDALSARGLPDPDLGFYENVELTSRASGVPLEEVLAEAKAARPLMMREDLPGALPMADAPLTPLPDPAPLTPLPDLDGPVGPAA